MRENPLKTIWYIPLVSALALGGLSFSKETEFLFILCTVGISLASGIFFRGIQRMVPAKTMPLLLILTWAVLAHALFAFFGIFPLWLLSLFLFQEEEFFLDPESGTRKQTLFQETLKKFFIRSAIFFIFNLLIFGMRQLFSIKPGTMLLWPGPMAALALYGCWEDSGIFKKVPALSVKEAKIFVREAVEIAVQILVLLMIGRAALQTWPFLLPEEVISLILFPSAYLINLARNGRAKNFMFSYAAASIIFFTSPRIAFAAQAQIAAGWATALGVFFIVVRSLSHQLKFSKPAPGISFPWIFLLYATVLIFTVLAILAHYPPFGYLTPASAPFLPDTVLSGL